MPGFFRPTGGSLESEDMKQDEGRETGHEEERYTVRDVQRFWGKQALQQTACYCRLFGEQFYHSPLINSSSTVIMPSLLSLSLNEDLASYFTEEIEASREVHHLLPAFLQYFSAGRPHFHPWLPCCIPRSSQRDLLRMSVRSCRMSAQNSPVTSHLTQRRVQVFTFQAMCAAPALSLWPPLYSHLLHFIRSHWPSRYSLHCAKHTPASGLCHFFDPSAWEPPFQDR